MKKKLLSLLITTFIATLTMSVPVCASTMGGSSTDSEAKTQNVPVTATLDSNYTVTLPASIVLTDNPTTQKFEGSYTCHADGNIAAGKYVSIVPSATFVMTGASSGTTATASVTQATTTWSRDVSATATPEPSVANSVVMGTNATGNVSVELTVDDAYTGNVTFTYQLH